MNDDSRRSEPMSFLEDTRLDRSSIHKKSRLQRPAISEPFKDYPDKKKTALPRSGWELQEARLIPLLQTRRSRRKYTSASINLNSLSFLLWCAQGVTAQLGNHYLRTAPSAGALYPTETYIYVQKVDGLTPGLYHFDPRDFQLDTLVERDMSTEFTAAFLNQSFINQSSFIFIWTAVAARTLAKYGSRGGRYLFFDAAHICQNVLLGAEAIGCGACPVAAFYDEELNRLLEIDTSVENVLYAASIGHKK